YRDDYLRSRIEGRVSRLLTIQGKLSKHSAAAWEIKMSKDHPICQGNSGAPLIETSSHQVIGVLASRDDDSGQQGIAITPASIRHAWPDFDRYCSPALNETVD